jgi:hypothetical protein
MSERSMRSLDQSPLTMSTAEADGAALSSPTQSTSGEQQAHSSVHKSIQSHEEA